MHMNSLSYDDLALYGELSLEISQKLLIEKIIFLSVCYFTIATEIRFKDLENKAMSKEINMENMLLSEIYHLKAIEISCKFIELHCPFINHLITSYHKHYNQSLEAIPEESICEAKRQSIREESVANQRSLVHYINLNLYQEKQIDEISQVTSKQNNRIQQEENYHSEIILGNRHSTPNFSKENEKQAKLKKLYEQIPQLASSDLLNGNLVKILKSAQNFKNKENYKNNGQLKQQCPKVANVELISKEELQPQSARFTSETNLKDQANRQEKLGKNKIILIEPLALKNLKQQKQSAHQQDLKFAKLTESDQIKAQLIKKFPSPLKSNMGIIESNNIDKNCKKRMKLRITNKQIENKKIQSSRELIAQKHYQECPI